MPADESWSDAVQRVVAEKISPLLQRHGGDLEVDGSDHTRGLVRVRFLGACCACPGAQRTLSELVETTLIEHCPGVRSVEIAPISQALLNEALSLLRSRGAAHSVRNG